MVNLNDFYAKVSAPHGLVTYKLILKVVDAYIVNGPNEVTFIRFSHMEVSPFVVFSYIY